MITDTRARHGTSRTTMCASTGRLLAPKSSLLSSLSRGLKGVNGICLLTTGRNSFLAGLFLLRLQCLDGPLVAFLLLILLFCWVIVYLCSLRGPTSWQFDKSPLAYIARSYHRSERNIPVHLVMRRSLRSQHLLSGWIGAVRVGTSDSCPFQQPFPLQAWAVAFLLSTVSRRKHGGCVIQRAS